LAILKNAQNKVAALDVAKILSGKEAVSLWAKSSKLPPVRRDLLASQPSDPVQSIFSDGALQSRSWLDPNKGETYKIFGDMVESLLSGKKSSYEAVSTANSKINDILKKM